MQVGVEILVNDETRVLVDDETPVAWGYGF
jgi:hypothetical protein